MAWCVTQKSTDYNRKNRTRCTYICKPIYVELCERLLLGDIFKNLFTTKKNELVIQIFKKCLSHLIDVPEHFRSNLNYLLMNALWNVFLTYHIMREYMAALLNIFPPHIKYSKDFTCVLNSILTPKLKFNQGNTVQLHVCFRITTELKNIMKYT